MIARNKIWEELKQAKANAICIERYTNRGRKVLRIIDFTIIISSTIGSLCGLFIDADIAKYGISFVALTSIFKTLLPKLLPSISQSEQELSELDSLMYFYSNYMDDLEEIWFDYDRGAITEKEMIDRLFLAKKKENDKRPFLNKLIRGISKKEQDEINKKIIEYFNRVFL